MIKSNNLYYNILILCVWLAIDSAPGHDRDMRSVSLELVGPEGVHCENFFPEKSSVAKLPKGKKGPLMLFYGKILYIYFALHFEHF